MHLRMCIGGLALFGLLVPANAQSFSNTIFFGDSTADSGRYFYLGGATVGPFTTNPDPMWSVILGREFGVTVTPSDAPGGGNNYAAGGARVVYTAPHSKQWSTGDQIAAYFSSTGGVADPRALYIYGVGANDLNTTTTGGPGNIVSPQNVPAITTLAQQAAAQVASLAAAGARYIIVSDTQTVLTPAAAAAAGYVWDSQRSASRVYYDQTVWNTLAENHVRFVPADFNSLMNYVFLNPAPFGFTVTNRNTPACGATVASINCTPANWVTPNADKTYIFADGPLSSTGGGHFTGAMQQVEADYYYALITAPGEISFLAEAPLKTRLTVIDAIDNQIPLSLGTPGAFHGWASGDVSWIKMTNNAVGFPDDPGAPFMTTAGFDYTITPDWLVGMAFSGLTTTQSFSPGGNYRQDEFAVSLYSAWRRQAVWADAIVSWGTLHDTVNRQIPLGITTQSNQGTTGGTNVSFASEVGYTFTNALGGAPAAAGMSYKAPPAAPLLLTHGPVVGVILQQVYVNGYTEFNPIGVPTALAFGSQTRNSAVTELGYQMSVKYGIWEPYVKLVWDHEWAELNRLVTASLTSITAPSFAMPAVILGRDWATATIGTRVKLGGNLSGYLAFIAEAGQANAMVYGGQIGLNYAFN